jgi:flagellar biosynthesis protein FlhG
VFIDLGAGTSFNTLDFFNFSPGKIAVFTGYATALQNVYGFIKCALFRKISREFAKEDQVLSLVYNNNAGASGDIASMTDLLSQVRRSSPESLFQLAGIIKPYRFFLVTNMVRSEQDLRSPEIIQSVCEEFLHIKPEILGHIFYDPVVEVAINQMEPALLQDRSNKIVKCLEHIARKIFKLSYNLESESVEREEKNKRAVILPRIKGVNL